MLQVTLHVDNQLAAALSGTARMGAAAVLGKKAGSNSAERISAIAERHGARIAPMHPGTSDPELRKHFFIRVRDQGAGERLSDELRGVQGVEGVYFKSSGEPPG